VGVKPSLVGDNNSEGMAASKWEASKPEIHR
jgi:hypothetical protein